MTSRIYLDNAATSWPKSESVYKAVDAFQREVGAAAGRGTYRTGQTSTRLVEQLRQGLRRLLDAPSDSEIVFAYSGTDALNLCLFGYLREGDHVVTSVAEHNSVLRPLLHLAESRGVAVSRVACESNGVVSSESIAAAMRPDTRLVVVTHASNVTGAIQPIERIANIAHQHRARILVDAAQTAGHLPLSVRTLGIDMLATSGHKGLGGPLGTGVCILAADVASNLTPYRFGGTGDDRASLQPLARDSQRFEAGNFNLPGLAGLAASVTEHLESADRPFQSMAQKTKLAIRALTSIPGLRLLGPTTASERVGLAAFTIDGWDCHEVGGILDSAFQIEVRAGLHCAPLMHAALDLPGSIRASWNPRTPESDILQLAEALKQITTARMT